MEPVFSRRTKITLVVLAVLAAGVLLAVLGEKPSAASAAGAQPKDVTSRAVPTDRRLDNCQKMRGFNGGIDKLSCEETRTYRGRDLYCVSSEAHSGLVATCDYIRFYAENPDLAAADAAAGKARATTPAK